MSTTCQICGRATKASKGVIAHHGYQRPGQGWQTASCFGARYRPYEVACDAIPLAIDSIDRFVAGRRDTLARLESNPPATLHEPPTYRRTSREFTRPDDFTPPTRRGSWISGTYEGEWVRLWHALNHEAKQAERDRVVLQQRLADWKEVA